LAYYIKLTTIPNNRIILPFKYSKNRLNIKYKKISGKKYPKGIPVYLIWHDGLYRGHSINLDDAIKRKLQLKGDERTLQNKKRDAKLTELEEYINSPNAKGRPLKYAIASLRRIKQTYNGTR